MTAQCHSTRPVASEKGTSTSTPARQSATKKYLARTIAFYNLENLFDTIDDPKTFDDDFTPNGKLVWTSDRYWKKIHHLSRVISEIGRKETGMPPVVVGVAEVENKNVLYDLINDEPLKKYPYSIVHFDSPDRRGIDVGLLFRRDIFKVTDFERYPLVLYQDGKRIYTRDVLRVSGFLDGEKFHFLVVHWPSRRGGEARSRPLRMKAAELDKRIIDSLRQAEPFSKIVMMGDLNDDPVSPSVKTVLGAKGKKSEVTEGGLYAAMEHFYRAGIGTLAYRDSWNLFDQIFVSYNLIEGTTGREKDYSSFKLWKSGIFNRPYLANSSGAFKGYPFRTYAGGRYLGGYSDHFPVYIIIIREM
ncbi:MAG: endonuclease/exonuclease/phosphatase family protein [Chlorobi bacterium]|nr:endonuclease/exonuclease/phosphatase family protein [Chlorobiota bacterium]